MKSISEIYILSLVNLIKGKKIMKKVLAPLALALLLLLLPVYAVSISLSSSSINQIGGTGLVEVNGPGSVSRVKWSLSGPPYRVNQVIIFWDANNDNSKYTVYVTVYDGTGSAIASGSASGQGGSDPIETTITLDTSVDPKNIYKVEIIIVEE